MRRMKRHFTLALVCLILLCALLLCACSRTDEPIDMDDFATKGKETVRGADITVPDTTAPDTAETGNKGNGIGGTPILPDPIPNDARKMYRELLEFVDNGMTYYRMEYEMLPDTDPVYSVQQKAENGSYVMIQEGGDNTRIYIVDGVAYVSDNYGKFAKISDPDRVEVFSDATEDAKRFFDLAFPEELLGYEGDIIVDSDKGGYLVAFGTHSKPDFSYQVETNSKDWNTVTEISVRISDGNTKTYVTVNKINQIFGMTPPI